LGERHCRGYEYLPQKQLGDNLINFPDSVVYVA
jgi:hypothetical protein